MSEIHEQAMHHVYQQVLQRLLKHMDRTQRASLQLLIRRLLILAGGPSQIAHCRLLVLHGADPRSASLLALLRAAQLSIAQRHGHSFGLRVLVVSLPCLDDALYSRYEQCFSNLCLHSDARVELLRIDAGQVGSFGPRQVCAYEQQSAARSAWLLLGQLAGGRPEVSLAARASLELAAGLGQVLAGVDGLISSIPERQRRRLLAWARRCARQALGAGAGTGTFAHNVQTLCAQAEQLDNLLKAPLQPSQPLAAARKPGPSLQVLCMDSLMQAQASAADTLFNPLPLAHLHGLHGYHVEQRSYRQSAEAYLAEWGAGEIAWPCGETLRDEAQVSLHDSYGITRDQLLCLLHRPFEARGRNLEAFIDRCHPRMRAAMPYLHRALQGQPGLMAVNDWLVTHSGLEIQVLRALYAGTLPLQVRQLAGQLIRRDPGLRWLPGRATGKLEVMGK